AARPRLPEVGNLEGVARGLRARLAGRRPALHPGRARGGPRRRADPPRPRARGGRGPRPNRPLAASLFASDSVGRWPAAYRQILVSEASSSSARQRTQGWGRRSSPKGNRPGPGLGDVSSLASEARSSERAFLAIAVLP